MKKPPKKEECPGCKTTLPHERCCMCHKYPQPLKQEDWEKEWAEVYLSATTDLEYKVFTDFIRNLLAKEREEIKDLKEVIFKLNEGYEQARKEGYHQGYVDAGTQGYSNHRDKRIRQEVLSEVEKEIDRFMGGEEFGIQNNIGTWITEPMETKFRAMKELIKDIRPRLLEIINKLNK